MKEIKCVVIDDDRFVREQINELLEENFPAAQLVASCPSGEEGIAAIKKHSPQLIFLDIQMPGMSGFEMLQNLHQHDFEIIFITSFNQYAIQAIRFSALDYLLKPLKPEEFRDAIARFNERMEEKASIRARLENLDHNLREKNSNNQRLVIPTKKGTEVLQVKDIVACHSESNYTAFVMLHGKKFLASKTLSRFEEFLQPAGFIRVHRSHLVNREFISAIKPEGFVVLKDGSRIEVSRRKLAEVKQALND